MQKEDCSKLDARQRSTTSMSSRAGGAGWAKVERAPTPSHCPYCPDISYYDIFLFLTLKVGFRDFGSTAKGSLNRRAQGPLKRVTEQCVSTGIGRLVRYWKKCEEISEHVMGWKRPEESDAENRLFLSSLVYEIWTNTTNFWADLCICRFLSFRSWSWESS